MAFLSPKKSNWLKNVARCDVTRFDLATVKCSIRFSPIQGHEGLSRFKKKTKKKTNNKKQPFDSCSPVLLNSCFVRFFSVGTRSSRRRGIRAVFEAEESWARQVHSLCLCLFLSESVLRDRNTHSIMSFFQSPGLSVGK